MGVITITVDVDPTLTDDQAPTISGVVGNFQSTVGNVEVIWTGTDNVGIDHYSIEIYKKNGNSYSKVGNTLNTVADETSYTVTGLSDGTYYFKVYGTDTSTNTATSSEISSCSTSSGHCSRSNDTAYKWHFTVTYKLTDASSSVGNSATVEYGKNHTSTLSGANNKNRPDSISSITMGSTTLSSGSGYSYNSSSGELTIYNITNDVTVTASGSSCLVKGTKILLKGGKVKNVEDIDYDDLLAVWNYDTGSITYEYPIWIENEHKTSKFTRITFSDDTYIDIAGAHSFYDTDINLFITNEDSKHFKVGEHIAKIDNDGNFKEVSINKMEDFLYKEYFGIGKYVISCCAADANYASFVAKYDDFDIKEGEWYEIEGVLEEAIDKVDNKILAIKIININKINSKDEEYYIYPCFSYSDGSCKEVTKYNLEPTRG